MNPDLYSIFDDSTNSEFYVHVLPLKDNFVSLKLSLTFLKELQDEIQRHLQLDSLQQLRDKFEGVAYYDKELRHIGAFKTLESLLKRPPRGTKFRINLKNDYSKIIFEGKVYQIVVFRFGQLPKIKTIDVPVDYMFVMQRDSRNFSFCGVLNNTIFKADESLGYTYFKDFNTLIYPSKIIKK